MSHDSAPLSSGTPVRALDFPPAQQVRDSTTISNITDTAYVQGTPEVAVRFQAPTSGRVAVAISAGVRNNSAANQDRLFVSFRILEGDPDDATTVQSEEVKLGISNHPIVPSDGFHYGGHVTMAGGLVPGAFYYCRVRYRTTLGSGTADISARNILVWPIP